MQGLHGCSREAVVCGHNKEVNLSAQVQVDPWGHNKVGLSPLQLMVIRQSWGETVTMVMSVLLLDYYEGGNLGKTAAFSLVQTVLLGVLIGGANWLSRGAAQGSVARTG